MASVGHPRQEGLLISPHLVSNKLGPRFGDGQEGEVYGAGGPKMAWLVQALFIASPLWGPPRWQGLCSQFAHNWAPKMAGYM